ncbi:MAG: Histidinol-phosphate aminotransferase [Lentisphaerae bacterium ADurb.BinA184]|nr:MAG: Histidinol-phosphate aminotransferase [Lentisphaerae bacterium ADurb.BinA184]
MNTYARNTIRAMSGYVPGEQPKDRRYVKLNTNENPYPPSAAVAAALHGFDAARLRLYPDPDACELRNLAAGQAGLTPDWILCGNGSDDLLTIAVRTFVDQGGTLAHTDPSYSLYPVLARLQGANATAVPLDAEFNLPPDAASRAAGATLLLVARPNAPTGNTFPLDSMHTLCRHFSGIVWIDEAYVDFADDDCLAFVRQYPNVVVSRTFSKSYSLAGLRLGLAYAPPALVSEMVKVKDSYNVSMLTQAVGLAALSDREAMRANAARIRATRDRVSGDLAALGFRVLPSQANFIFCQPPVAADVYAAGLRREGILIRYFPGPRTGAFVRITIGTDEEMAQLLAATRRLLGR